MKNFQKVMDILCSFVYRLKNDKKLQILLVSGAIAIVLITNYALIRPAISLDRQASETAEDSGKETALSDAQQVVFLK